MQIMFHGEQTAEEAADSLLNILQLLKSHYGIGHFQEIDLHVTLMDGDGQEVELVDSVTSEVLGTFEIYKHGQSDKLMKKNRPDIRLVVDNTKK